MKNFTLLFFLLCLSFFQVSAQTRKTPVKPAPKKPAALPSSVPVQPEISDTEWGTIRDSLNDENWTQSANLLLTAINKLKAENGKKQLAQLRYFYLYALAGKVVDGKLSFAELEKIANGFIGKEFLMPPRVIAADCTGKIHVICSVKDSARILRVTAANKSATAIHLFERVQLSEDFDVKMDDGKNAYLGGILKKVEVNPEKSNVWIMKVFFDPGSVNIISGT